MKRSSAGQAIVSLIRGQKWKLSWRKYHRGANPIPKNRNLFDSQPNQLNCCRQHSVRANKRSAVSDRDVTHADFVEIAKPQRRLQKELRPSCRAILVASLVGRRHGRVGLLVAMNHSDNMR
jgi:hypothetical protein